MPKNELYAVLHREKAAGAQRKLREAGRPRSVAEVWAALQLLAESLGMQAGAADAQE